MTARAKARKLAAPSPKAELQKLRQRIDCIIGCIADELAGVLLRDGRSLAEETLRREVAESTARVAWRREGAIVRRGAEKRQRRSRGGCAP